MNLRKDVLAIDVAHDTVLSTLSKLTEPGGMNVHSYVDLDSGSTTGVMYNMDLSISRADLPILVKPAVDGIAITNMSRLSTSRCMEIIFKGKSLSLHIKVGHIRHTVRPFIPRPLQCCNWMRMGHLSAVCENTRVCLRCAVSQAVDFWAASVPKCTSCLGSHDAPSKDCPKMKKEKVILKVMAGDYSSRWEAVAAVRRSWWRMIELGPHYSSHSRSQSYIRSHSRSYSRSRSHFQYCRAPL